MKRCLLILIDALTARILVPAIENGSFPNFQQLSEAGGIWESCSIFPSITHAALSSLATGVYPKDHKVLGSCWYREEAREIAYLGADPQIIWNEGIGTFFQDFMIRLNHQWLRYPTIFQRIGNESLSTTCVNHLIFRGDREHQINTPLIMKLVPGLSENDGRVVMGPDRLFLGEFVMDTTVSNTDIGLLNMGPQNWFGFKDASARQLLLQLAAEDAYTDFTLAYFPETDFLAHRHGPEKAHEELTHMDEMLGNLFAEYGGLEKFLSEFTILITGDHSQSDVQEGNPEIDLEKILSPFQCATAGQMWQEDDEIIVCPNLRAAHLYLREPGQTVVQQVVKKLLSAPSIDQIICAAGWFDAAEEGYYIFSDRGELHFWRGDMATDEYGNKWSWKGELAAVDGSLKGNDLAFYDYPNAFERLWGVLESEESGQIWITADPGHEFFIPGAKIHAGGGSHGSLHRLDSISPLIVAGLPDKVAVPARPRIVDIAPLCQSVLDRSL